MSDEHLLAKFAGTIYLHIRQPSLSRWAAKELIYLRTLLWHRPHLQELAAQIEEDLVGRIEDYR